ncbi:MAG TPA: hypothetical protein VIJ79_17095 [Acidobacteriaceae bacterium]
MKTARIRSFSRTLGVALCTVTLGALWGCGSGVGLPASSLPGTTTPAASTQGPQLGYFWNAADETLRPILGVPGSSQVGRSVVPAGTYIAAGASSANAVAVLEEPDGSLDVMTLPSGQPVHVTAKAAATGAQIRFSPDGKSAIVFAVASGSVTLLTGLPSAASATVITSPVAVLDAVVSDAGSVAVAAASSAGVSIHIGATTVGNAGALGGLSFASGDDLLFADAAANTLTLVHNASSKPSPVLVPNAALLMTPAGLGVSQNGQWALVANSGEASAVRIDLTGQNAPLRIVCNCTPALVAPLSGMGTFRITAPGAGAVWAVDAGVNAPRSFFIPALAGTGAHP